MIGPDDTHVWSGSNLESPFPPYHSVMMRAAEAEGEGETVLADPWRGLSIETHASVARTDTLAVEFDMTNGEFMSDLTEVCLPPSSFTAKRERSTEVEGRACPATGCMSPRIGKKRARAPGVSRGRGKSYKCPVSRGAVCSRCGND